MGVTSVKNNGRIDDTYCFTEPKRNMGIFNGILTGNCNEITLHTNENEIAVINIKNNTVETRWSLAPAEGPTGLDIDTETKRLFAGCDKLLVVIDITTGKVIDKLPIGDGCDGVAFDKSLHYIFASCGEGKLSIIHEEAANKFTVVDNVPTKRSARTIAINEILHTVYLPTADFGAPAAGQNRPPVIPGSFQVLVMQQ